MINSHRPIRVLFITHSLGSGGAEKVFQLLMNNLERPRFQVQCILINQRQHNASLLQDIDLHELKYSSTLRAIGQIRKTIRKLKPDLVVGTISPINIILPIIRITLPVHCKSAFVIRESTVMSFLGRKDGFKNVLVKSLVRLFYHQYAGIICQSRDIRDDLIENFKVDPKNLFIINNPIQKTPVPEVNRKENRELQLITVGRIRPEKGHDRLLDVIKAFEVKCGLEFKYHIVGDFPTAEAERMMMNKTEQLGLQNRIIYHGHIDEPETILKDCDLFLQGSYYEGFPNAVLESCAAGVPVVAFDVPGGTKEIIRQGFNGYLAEENDIGDFVDKMILALHTEWQPLEIAGDVHNRFGQDKIIQAYQELFTAIASQQ